MLQKRQAVEVIVDFSKIKDWDTFHSMFSESMGFPGFYGKNMNAWIDCMSYIDDPDSGMSSVTVKPGESLEIVVLGTESAIKSCSEIFQIFIECTVIVNQRFIKYKTNTRLKIIAT